MLDWLADWPNWRLPESFEEEGEEEEEATAAAAVNIDVEFDMDIRDSGRERTG